MKRALCWLPEGREQSLARMENQNFSTKKRNHFLGLFFNTLEHCMPNFLDCMFRRGKTLFQTIQTKTRKEWFRNISPSQGLHRSQLFCIDCMGIDCMGIRMQVVCNMAWFRLLETLPVDIDRDHIIALHYWGARQTMGETMDGQYARWARGFREWPRPGRESRKQAVMAARSTFYLDHLHDEWSSLRFPSLTYGSEGILRTLAIGNWKIENVLCGEVGTVTALSRQRGARFPVAVGPMPGVCLSTEIKLVLIRGVMRKKFFLWTHTHAIKARG